MTEPIATDPTIAAWRVGGHYGIHLYTLDASGNSVSIGTTHTMRAANMVVRAVNLVYFSAGDFMQANEALGEEVVKLRRDLQALGVQYDGKVQELEVLHQDLHRAIDTINALRNTS